MDKLIDELPGLTQEQLLEVFTTDFVLGKADIKADIERYRFIPMLPGDPAMSNPVRKLVAMGAKAIPSLCKRMDDSRAVGKPFQSSFFSALVKVEAFDWNLLKARTTVPPMGEDDLSMDSLEIYQPTVGDLCFFILGQIVNRAYVPMWGNSLVFVNAPSKAPTLMKFARIDWATVDESALLKSLTFDFLNPDWRMRDQGAMLRLVQYFPEHAERLALKRIEEDFQSMRTGEWKEPPLDNRRFPPTSWVRFPGTLYGLKSSKVIELIKKELDDLRGRAIKGAQVGYVQAYRDLIAEKG